MRESDIFGGRAVRVGVDGFRDVQGRGALVCHEEVFVTEPPLQMTQRVWIMCVASTLTRRKFQIRRDFSLAFRFFPSPDSKTFEVPPLLRQAIGGNPMLDDGKDVRVSHRLFL